MHPRPKHDNFIVESGTLTIISCNITYLINITPKLCFTIHSKEERKNSICIFLLKESKIKFLNNTFFNTAA